MFPKIFRFIFLLTAPAAILTLKKVPTCDEAVAVLGQTYACERQDQIFSKEYFGVIYRIHKVKDGQKFLLKVTVPQDQSLRAVDHEMEMAKREREILQEYPDSNLVAVVEAGEMAGGHVLVLEYPNNGRLDQYLQAKKDTINYRNPLQVLTLFSKIMDGVEHLHGNHLIYRSLTLKNIFMFDDEPKIANLEQTVEAGYETDGSDFTRELLDPFSLLEFQTHKKVRAVTKNDVYALGVILYQLLYHTSPYESRRTNEDPHRLALLHAPVLLKKGTPYPLAMLLNRMLLLNHIQRISCSSTVNAVKKMILLGGLGSKSVKDQFFTNTEIELLSYPDAPVPVEENIPPASRGLLKRAFSWLWSQESSTLPKKQPQTSQSTIKIIF